MKIDRNHQVWAATYGAAFHGLLGDELKLSQWPDNGRLLAICEDAQTVADAAVEALDEHLIRTSPSSDTEQLTAILEAYRSWDGSADFTNQNLLAFIDVVGKTLFRRGLSGRTITVEHLLTVDD